MADLYGLYVDMGFGAFKTASEKGVSQFPSHVASATRATYAATFGDEYEERPTLVEFGDHRYHTGLYADHAGTVVNNLGFDRLTAGAPPIRALFYGAVTDHFRRHGGTRKAIDLWVALPVELLTADRIQETTDAMQWLVGKHTWRGDAKSITIDVQSLTIRSQPDGAIYDYAFDDSGTVVPEHHANLKKEVGTMLIGMNTVEYRVRRGGRPDDGLTRGPQEGVRRLLDIINKDGFYKLSTLDTMLRTGALNGELDAAKPDWIETLRGETNQTWGNQWRRFAAIIVAGGGATEALAGTELTQYFAGKAYIPDDPVHSIAIGLMKAAKAKEKAADGKAG